MADKDYRDPHNIEKVKDEATNEHLLLHVWHRKEIENYLIIPQILFKFIPKSACLTYDTFLKQLEALLDEQYDKVFDAYATQYRIDCKELANGQQWDTATCNQNARAYLKEHWNTLDDKIALVGGKDFLSYLSKFYQDNFKVTLSPKKILDEITVELISAEIIQFLEQFKQ